MRLFRDIGLIIQMYMVSQCSGSLQTCQLVLMFCNTHVHNIIIIVVSVQVHISIPRWGFLPESLCSLSYCCLVLNLRMKLVLEEALLYRRFPTGLYLFHCLSFSVS